MTDKIYKLLKNNQTIESSIPGEYAGWKYGKIFGRLDCKSGKEKMRKTSRVFFENLEDAVNEGYSPCLKCMPIDEQDFETIKHLVPEYKTLHEFYNRDKK